MADSPGDLPSFIRRVESAVADARGLMILDTSLIIMDGQVYFWSVTPTQYEPHNPGRRDARQALLEALIATRQGKAQP